MKNVKENLFEYVLLLFFFVLFVWLFTLPSTPCEKLFPRANDIVDCMATRTAEAHNK